MIDIDTLAKSFIGKPFIMTTNMESSSKWKCRKCKVVIPYNPTYDMSNVLCSNCQAYENADKLLGGYRMPTKRVAQ